MQIASVLALFADLNESELICWVDRGWVRPDDDPSGWAFHDIDVARIRLIRDLRRELAVADDTIPLILSLLDQVYALRDRLAALQGAVMAQPDQIRRAIVGAMR